MPTRDSSLATGDWRQTYRLYTLDFPTCTMPSVVDSREKSSGVRRVLGGILLAAAGFGVISLAGLGLGVALFTLVMALGWAHRLIGLRARPAAT